VTRLRVVAVGLRVTLDRLVSRQAWVDSLATTIDRIDRTTDADTLVALPEHTGLLTLLLGPGGRAAREVLAGGGSLEDALLAVAVEHGPALGRCAERFPDARGPGALLQLALTDTLVHGLVEPVRDLARSTGWWFTVGLAVADWQPVAADPGPDDRDPRYEPTTAEVRNRNLVVAPSGELAAVHDKAYLVPEERDAAGLALTPAPLDTVGVAALPFARLASVISKDAWMVDVNERLDQLGAQLLIQPEAFDRWHEPAVVDDPSQGTLVDLWPPDKFQRGGWWMVQRHPSLAVNVTPQLLGGVGGLAFDGQPLVAVSAPDGAEGLGLLGQRPAPGWRAVGRWWRDRAPAAALVDPARRRRPVTAPASDRHDLLAVATVELPSTPTPVAPPARVTAEVSVEVPSAGSGLVPDVAVVDGAIWLAWIEGDGRGRQAVVTARWHDGRWVAEGEVHPPTAGTPPPFDRRWRPRLVAAGATPVCVHLGFPSDSWDLFAARWTGTGWAAPARVDDADRLAGVVRERGHDAPAVVATGEGVTVVWSDLRWPWVLPHVRVARSADGGRRWGPSRRVDGGPLGGPVDPTAPPAPGPAGGQTAPSIAAVDGAAVVAWQGPRDDGAPTTWVARLGGGPPRRLTDRPGRRWRPVVGTDGRRVWLVDEVEDGHGGRRLELSRSDDHGRRWRSLGPLDRTRPDGVVQARAQLVPVDGDLVVVYEDHRAGSPVVLARSVGRAGSSDAPGRVDDAPAGAAARAPTAAAVRGTIVVAWQDTRSGTDRVRSIALPAATVTAGSTGRSP
jgi:hypothetical protein